MQSEEYEIRQTRSKAGISKHSREPLPDDWMAFNTEFPEAHNLFLRDLTRKVNKDGMAPAGPHVRERFEDRWLGHGPMALAQPVKTAYDLEQHRQVARAGGAGIA